MGQKSSDSGDTANTITAAEHDAAVTAAEAKGFESAQKRINEIMALDEAKGRESTAMHFATTNALSVDEVKAALATVPVVPAKAEDAAPESAPRNHFAEKMDEGGSPDVGSPGDDGEKATDPVDTFWANTGQPASAKA